MSGSSAFGVTSKMDRWRIVRSIIDFPRSRKGGSLGRLSHHLTDETNVTIGDLTRALCLELGMDAAGDFATCLHCAFRDTSSSSALSSSGNSLTSLPAAVDARYIVATYRATILAKAAFRNPTMVYLKLMEDFVTKDGNNSWLLTAVARVMSIAAVNDEEEKSTGVQLTERIHQLTTSSIITMDVLLKALELSPTVLQSFRSQLVAKLSQDERLALMAGEEVSHPSNLMLKPGFLFLMWCLVVTEFLLVN
jgi:hypothetical protein